MDRLGFFRECFGGELFVSSTVRAALLGKVVGWSLRERAMIATDDRDFGVGVYIVNL